MFDCMSEDDLSIRTTGNKQTTPGVKSETGDSPEYALIIEWKSPLKDSKASQGHQRRPDARMVESTG